MNTYAAYHVMWGGVDPMGLEVQAKWKFGPMLTVDNIHIGNAKILSENFAEGRGWILDNWWLEAQLTADGKIFGDIECCDTSTGEKWTVSPTFDFNIDIIRQVNAGNRLFTMNMAVGALARGKVKMVGYALKFKIKGLDIIEIFDTMKHIKQFLVTVPHIKAIRDSLYDPEQIKTFCQLKHNPTFKIQTPRVILRKIKWLSLPGENKPIDPTETAVPLSVDLPGFSMPLP